MTPNQIHVRLMSPTSFEKNEYVLYSIILECISNESYRLEARRIHPCLTRF